MKSQFYDIFRVLFVGYFVPFKMNWGAIFCFQWKFVLQCIFYEEKVFEVSLR